MERNNESLKFIRHQKAQNIVSAPEMDKEEFLKQNMKRVVVLSGDPLQPLLEDANVENYSHNDVYLLFNQDRIEIDAGTSLAAALRSRFQQRNVENPFEGMTDEQIVSTIKSRGVQTFSELESWIQYLDSQRLKLSDVVSERFKSYVDSEKYKAVLKEMDSEPEKVTE